MLILVVEDETAIVRFLERGLASHGHRVLSADNGEEGARLALEEPVDAVLLDISLPGLGGREVLRRIRSRRPELPILMLTARDDLPNKVGALNDGADDYLTKPFAFEELLARIRALTRRADQPRAAQLRADGHKLDLLARRLVRGPQDRALQPGVRPAGVLHAPPQAGSEPPADTLAVWAYDFDPGSNVVDVYVRHLRNKIDRPGEPFVISTVRGAGYHFGPRLK